LEIGEVTAELTVDLEVEVLEVCFNTIACVCSGGAAAAEKNQQQQM
jgi:hypothetical protein